MPRRGWDSDSNPHGLKCCRVNGSVGFEVYAFEQIENILRSRDHRRHCARRDLVLEMALFARDPCTKVDSYFFKQAEKPSFGWFKLTAGTLKWL